MKQAYCTAYEWQLGESHLQWSRGSCFSVIHNREGLYEPEYWQKSFDRYWRYFRNYRQTGRSEDQSVATQMLGKLCSVGIALHTSLAMAASDQPPVVAYPRSSWTVWSVLEQVTLEPKFPFCAEWSKDDFYQTNMGLTVRQLGLPLDRGRLLRQEALDLARRQNIAGFRLFAGYLDSLPDGAALPAPGLEAGNVVHWQPTALQFDRDANRAMVAAHNLGVN